MRVLVIGDLHAPAVHKDYMGFVKSVKKKYRTNKTVFIGDIVDSHAISFHAKHPEAPAAMAEYNNAMSEIKKWHKAFPDSIVTIGNHDERVHRIAADRGIPAMYLKEYAEVYETPRWDWENLTVIDGVCYTHGAGSGGINPAFGLAKSRMQSVVCGHNHSLACINWTAGPEDRLFGMQIGCGVDRHHIAMDYGKNMLRKPMVSCGIVIDGHPYLELMHMGS